MAGASSERANSIGHFPRRTPMVNFSSRQMAIGLAAAVPNPFARFSNRWTRLWTVRRLLCAFGVFRRACEFSLCHRPTPRTPDELVGASGSALRSLVFFRALRESLLWNGRKCLAMAEKDANHAGAYRTLRGCE